MNPSEIEIIEDSRGLIAIIIRRQYKAEGLKFITTPDYSQQLACMHHPKGKYIDAHWHPEQKREIYKTQEVLIIREGSVRVDFYDQDQKYIRSKVLQAGDVLFLARGGHGFEVLENLDMVEVKTGPYLESKDKVRFPHVEPERICIT
jgi:mannose-6-phosphate isomerase-like protein (cupin superfamily)